MSSHPNILCGVAVVTVGLFGAIGEYIPSTFCYLCVCMWGEQIYLKIKISVLLVRE